MKMKLLKREYILWALLILFIAALIPLSFFRKGTTKLEHSETNSVAYIVNLNTASAKELEMLEGIGPKLAGEIVKNREEYGSFKYIEQLHRVPGIGQAVLDKIKDYSKV